METKCRTVGTALPLRESSGRSRCPAGGSAGGGGEERKSEQAKLGAGLLVSVEEGAERMADGVQQALHGVVPGKQAIEPLLPQEFTRLSLASANMVRRQLPKHGRQLIEPVGDDGAKAFRQAVAAVKVQHGTHAGQAIEGFGAAALLRLPHDGVPSQDVVVKAPRVQVHPAADAQVHLREAEVFIPDAARIAQVEPLDEAAAVDLVPRRVVDGDGPLGGDLNFLLARHAEIALHFFRPGQRGCLDGDAVADEVDVLRHVRQQLGVGVGLDVIVRIDRGDELGTAGCQPGVARGGEPAVLLVNDADARVAGGVCFEDGGRAVG